VILGDGRIERGSPRLRHGLKLGKYVPQNSIGHAMDAIGGKDMTDARHETLHSIVKKLLPISILMESAREITTGAPTVAAAVDGPSLWRTSFVTTGEFASRRDHLGRVC